MDEDEEEPISPLHPPLVLVQLLCWTREYTSNSQMLFFRLYVFLADARYSQRSSKEVEGWVFVGDESDLASNRSNDAINGRFRSITTIL